MCFFFSYYYWLKYIVSKQREAQPYSSQLHQSQEPLSCITFKSNPTGLTDSGVTSRFVDLLVRLFQSREAALLSMCFYRGAWFVL